MEFAIRCSPAIQRNLREAGADYARCAGMDCPTLWEIRETYGMDCLRDWMAAMVMDLNDFCNVRDKMTSTQKDEAAHILSCEYGHLNVAEAALFFTKVKSGVFGEFYGILDTVRLMAIMRKFIVERGKALVADEDARRKRALEEDRDRWRREATPPETLERWFREGKFNNLKKTEVGGGIARVREILDETDPQRSLSRREEK